MSLKWGPMVGVSEIAEMADVTKQVVSNWKTRSADFPRPAADLASGPVFAVAEVVAWLKSNRGSTLCPVCLNPAERGRDADYGERKQVRCPRCGPFMITRTALAMLHSRTSDDQLARARLSHAIRMATGESEWLLIDSMNLDVLVKMKLPEIGTQLRNLTTWIAEKLGDDQLGMVPFEPENLAAIVGATNGDRVERLIDFGLKRGILTRKGDKLGLTEEFLVSDGTAAVSLEPRREKPVWAERLEDSELRDVLDDVYRVLAVDSLRSTSVMVRTLLDRATSLCVGDVGGFGAKLNAMVERGIISETDREILEAATDAGNASAHRAYTPSRGTLYTILDAAENFLHRQFILVRAVTEVRMTTPRRRR